MTSVIQFKKKEPKYSDGAFYYELRGCHLENDTYWWSCRLVGTEDWSEWQEYRMNRKSKPFLKLVE